MQFILANKRAPLYVELAPVLGVSIDRARELIHQAREEVSIGNWFLADTDVIECWAPFSNIPTNYRISIDGEPGWYGQCGLEALAATWVAPGKEIRIDSHCLDCGDPVTVVQRDGEVLRVDPEDAVGHMNEPFSSGDWATRASYI
jgi:hypothetical protein